MNIIKKKIKKTKKTKGNKLNKSSRQFIPQFNVNSFTIIGNKQEMDFNLCVGNEKRIDNEISFKIRKNEHMINAINKNDDNKIENNKIINKKEIIKEDKDKNNENKNISKNEIKEVENKENKKIKNKVMNKNECVNNKIILNKNRFEKKYLDEEKEMIIKAKVEKTLKLLEETIKELEYIKYHSLNRFLVLEKINIFNSVLIILNNISFIKDYFSSNIDI